MTAKKTGIQKHGRGHSYRLDGEKVIGVTTALGDGFPKPALIGWGAKQTAGFVANRLQVADDGRIVADELVADALAWNLERDRPAAVSPGERLDRVALAEILAALRYRDLDQASGRGTEVHKLAEQLARGEAVDPPDELRGHATSYVKFLEEWEPTNARLEVPVFSREWGYGGRFDLLADFPGKIWPNGTPVGTALLDVKTARSGVYPDNALQLAGYRYAEFMLIDDEEIPLPPIDWCGVIHVRADGYSVYRFNLTEYEHRIFLFAKAIAAWNDYDGGRGRRIMSRALAAPEKKEATP